MKKHPVLLAVTPVFGVHVFLFGGLTGYRRFGLSDAQLLENFPTLKAIDLANAWAYGAAHRDEIEQAIRENEEA